MSQIILNPGLRSTGLSPKTLFSVAATSYVMGLFSEYECDYYTNRYEKELQCSQKWKTACWSAKAGEYTFCNLSFAAKGVAVITGTAGFLKYFENMYRDFTQELKSSDFPSASYVKQKPNFFDLSKPQQPAANPQTFFKPPTNTFSQSKSPFDSSDPIKSFDDMMARLKHINTAPTDSSIENSQFKFAEEKMKSLEKNTFSSINAGEPFYNSNQEKNSNP